MLGEYNQTLEDGSADGDGVRTTVEPGEPVPPFPGCPEGMAPVPEAPPPAVGLTRARCGMLPASDRAWSAEARAAWESGTGLAASMQAQLNSLQQAPPTQPAAAAAASAAVPPTIQTSAALRLEGLLQWVVVG